MNLFSLEFVILLLITFALYYAAFGINKLAKRIIIPQWLLLLIASLIFYGFVNYVYLIYLGISFFVSYVTAICCQYKLFKRVPSDEAEAVYEFSPSRVSSHLERKRYETIITAISILVNVGILAVLKYFNFFASSVNSLLHLSITTYNFIIPLGISFYTFSLIAYNVDCCKRTTNAEKNPFKFLLFVSYFPKVLQGPISSYDRLKQDGLFSEHGFKDNNYLKAFFRISIGLIKKIAIANVLNLYVNASYSNLENSFGGGLLLTSVLYTIQLYCDFSGFADITIGVSNLFGIKLEENFNIPYISSSISEFWRRWHITLGAWLKKYIYIPLGGNRVPVWRWIINTLIVWLISGLWHGANWTFVIWGLFHGILIVLSGLPKQIKKKSGATIEEKENNRIIKILSIIGTFVLVNIGWIFFRSNSIGEAGTFIVHSIQFWKTGSYSLFSDPSISKANWLFIVSIIFVIVLILIKVLSVNKRLLEPKIWKGELITTISTYVITIVFFSISIFVFIYLNSIGGGESSFIYFDF